MRRRWLARTTLAVALGIVIWILMPQDAAADDDQVAADDNATIIATQVNRHCDHGGPYRDQDVWIFQGPGAATLDEATFIDGTGQVEVRTSTEKAYDLAGHSVMWLTAPAGWSLTEIKPKAFKVVGACPAAAQGTDAAQGTAAASGTDAVQGKAVQGKAVQGKAVQGKAAQGKEDGQAAHGLSKTSTLPQTGQDVTAMVTLGSALVITGVLLLFVRRQRPNPRPPARDQSDHVWTYPTYRG